MIVKVVLHQAFLTSTVQDIVKLKEENGALQSGLQDLKQANSGEIRKLQVDTSSRMHKLVASL